MADKLIKIDKNGTKYYASTICRRCGGAGGAEQWALTGFTCYRCGGSGIDPHPSVYKEYTEEYAKKLEARRAKAFEKKKMERKAKAEELNKEFFERNSFSPEGKTYVALGDSYSIKDQLKEKGFHFTKFIGWVSPVKVDGVKTLELDASECYCSDYAGVYSWDSPRKAYFLGDKRLTEEEAMEDWTWESGFHWDWNGAWLVKQANEEIKEELPSEFIGEVGQKISVEVTLKRRTEWETTFGYRTRTNFLYIMADKNGNTLTWKTQNLLGFDDVEENGMTYFHRIDTDLPFTITGRVKEHTVYNGVKQTVLERCKVEQCCICTE